MVGVAFHGIWGENVGTAAAGADNCLLAKKPPTKNKFDEMIGSTKRGEGGDWIFFLPIPILQFQFSSSFLFLTINNPINPIHPSNLPPILSSSIHLHLHISIFPFFNQ
jgi:hypothetical protein